MEIHILNSFNKLIILLLKKYPKTKFNDWKITCLNGQSGRSFLVLLKNKKLKFFARFYEKRKWFFCTNKRKEWKILKKLNSFFFRQMYFYLIESG